VKERELPKGREDAARYFADPDACVAFVAGLRWMDGPVCPYCGGMKISYLRTRRIYKCMAKECHKQFSVKVGTIFEDSAIPLDKWLIAIWLVVNCKSGISSYEIARDLKVTQKSAWFLLHRIRLALANSSWLKRGGEEGGLVEVDETFMGGKEKDKLIPNRRFIPDGKGGFMENPDYRRRKGHQKKAPNLR
jgi:transposase-like protein